MPGFTLGDTIHPRPSRSLDPWDDPAPWLPDFTPVCTRELGKMAMYAEEFETRGVKLLGFSCDDVASHVEWIKDVEDYASGCKVRFPIVVDHNREAIRQLNMVDLNQKDADGVELPSRALHVIGPDKIDQAQLPLPCNHREKHGRSGAGGGVPAEDCKF
ncbi:hypothetical protein OPV22_028570 [Ensete ventricosum]|uniref:Alkyl hydroperoxide reductase subunit C/ Thiol specific antioxidant domain-containing protein n=1 Tax=Ensete ventricosum TaxID=4639 RepID=A0AAV8Q6S7_ENSVE|nr:hypothetical protein OPV22_028570 [Ensete ventricosum]